MFLMHRTICTDRVRRRYLVRFLKTNVYSDGGVMDIYFLNVNCLAYTYRLIPSFLINVYCPAMFSSPRSNTFMVFAVLSYPVLTL